MKPLLITFFGFLTCIDLAAQVVGPSSGNTFLNSNIPGSTQSWTNTGNVSLSDNNYASFGDITAGMGSYTDYLVTTNFGFTLPPGIIIDGIVVKVECSDPNSRTSEYSVHIVKTGNIGTEEKALGKPYPVSDKNIVYGSATDLWGETWTDKQINDDNFGIAISAQRNAPDGITAGQIDNITITVYYSFIALPVTLISFTATKENKSILLNWNTASEISMDHYEPERSSNGINFYPLGIITSNNLSTAHYSFVDVSPLSGVSYYRLKMEGTAGYKKYSSVVSVLFDKHATISLYPCPLTKGTELFINNAAKELLRIQFYNAGGQMISTLLTSSDNVSTNNLGSQKGKLYYNVFNAKSELLGSGTLIIQ